MAKSRVDLALESVPVEFYETLARLIWESVGEKVRRNVSERMLLQLVVTDEMIARVESRVTGWVEEEFWKLAEDAMAPLKESVGEKLAAAHQSAMEEILAESMEAIRAVNGQARIHVREVQESMENRLKESVAEIVAKTEMLLQVMKEDLPKSLATDAEVRARGLTNGR